MKAVFINDHPFYVDANDSTFTSGTLSADVWKRFTDNFGTLTVIGRGVKISELHTHKQSDCEGVEFDLFYEIKGGLDYFKFRKAIERKLLPYILGSEYIILRLPSNIGVIAASLCRKYKRKYLVEVVGCAFDSMWFFGNKLGKVMAYYSQYQNKIAIKGASAAVYVTKDYLQKRYPNNNPQINASNVVLEYVNEEVLYSHLNYLDQSNQPKKIGMIGNISLAYKGFEVLFQALSKIAINFELYIVGGGDDGWIKNLIQKYGLQNKVKLKGRINNRSEINNFLDSLDLYVQPSLTEGLPRSLIEAMSRACPIIASDAGGIPELLPEKFVYRRDKAGSLAIILNDMLGNPAILKEAAKLNYKHSKEYTFDVINERRYNFLNKIKNQLKNI